MTSAQKGQKENAPSNESPSTGEAWNVRSVTVRKFTRVSRAPERFEDYAKVAVEYLVTMEEAMES